MACAICQTRRPRRFCPGVRGDICSVCCGTEREVTVSCPLDCEYLQEARKHEKLPSLEGIEIPNRDLRVSEAQLRDREELLAFMAGALLRAAFEIPGVVDQDIREALDALIRTYRTLQSGVYYETRPENTLAAGICGMMQNAVTEYRREETERLGMTRTRDADVLGLLVFLQHFELDRNNGRRRGRAFLDALRGFYAADRDPAPAPASSLILP
jgi:hypothetical protein